MAENEGILYEVTGGANSAGLVALPSMIVTRNEFNKPQGYAGLSDEGQTSDDVESDLGIASAIESMQDLSNTE